MLCRGVEVAIGKNWGVAAFLCLDPADTKGLVASTCLGMLLGEGLAASPFFIIFGWRPNIRKKGLTLVLLETVVLISNKTPSMQSSQSSPFLSMTFLRMLKRKEITVIGPTCTNQKNCKISGKGQYKKGQGANFNRFFSLLLFKI